ncbi:hypothetical protein ACH4PU_31000 [Streptomyces sp. NPDC021100]|uniref:hypothetical protein n=1 Tax=Streptomyces sp. NPDC021100 TaxID=3365114 RepID=UPI003795FD88
MRSSHTFSRHWDLETRQHELLGIDLGEGISRKVLLHGLIVFTLWDGALLLVAGIPSTLTFSFYFLPPILITVYGTKRSAAYWRRRNFLLWGVTANYLINGVKPVIGRGRIPAPRPGWRLRAARLGERFPKLAGLPLFGTALTPGDHEDLAESLGKPVHLKPRVRLYGPDAVARARTKTLKRTRTRKKNR